MKTTEKLRATLRGAVLVGFVGTTLFALTGCGSSEPNTPPPAPANGERKPDLTQDEK